TDFRQHLAAHPVGGLAVTLENGVEHAFARAEVVVERGDVALPRSHDDLAHGHLVEPAPREQPLCFTQQRCSGGGGVARHEPYRDRTRWSVDAATAAASSRSRG